MCKNKNNKVKKNEIELKITRAMRPDIKTGQGDL